MANQVTSSILQTARHIIRLPFRIILYPLTLLSNPTQSSPEARQLGDTLRTQLKQECQFRLDTSSSATITLPDGRSLGYAQYGDPSGKPIIKLHGLPGSRLEESAHDSIARKIGLSIIGVDRPGVGLSTPDPSLTFQSFAADIEALATHLNLETFAVIGTSGGGPYALACARYLPAEKLTAVAIVCGMGDMQRFPSSKGMGWRNWLGYRFAIDYIPWIFRWDASKWPVNQSHLSEEEKLEASIQQIVASNPSQQDIEAWNTGGGVDLLRLSLRASQEYFLHGLDFLVQDAKLLGSAWEFCVEDIDPNLPLHLWYGTQDLNVSGQHGVEIAKRFRGNAKLRLLEETHMSLQVKYRDRILDEILQDM